MTGIEKDLQWMKVYQKQFVCAQHGFKIEHFDGKSVQEICLECGHKEFCVVALKGENGSNIFKSLWNIHRNVYLYRLTLI